MANTKPPKNASLLRKIWYFLWEDDSMLSWVVNVIVAFILIKFLLYPGMGFIMQTDHPVVAVVSESMEHKTLPVCEQDFIISGFTLSHVCSEYKEGTYEICGRQIDQKGYTPFDDYWRLCGGFYERLNISQDEFSDFDFRFGFNKGDIMVLYGTPTDKVEVGDTIVFMSGDGRPIIHRVVNIVEENGERVFQTKGDRNPSHITVTYLNELAVTEEQYIGRAVFRVPLLGYVKIIFTDVVLAVFSVLR